MPDDAQADPDVVDLTIEAPGAEEIAVVPWPMMWRERMTRRVRSSDRYPWIVLAAALFGLFSVGFSITVLTVAIPTIARDLGASEDVLIWTVTGPILLGAMVAPAAGKLADLYGARRVYLLAMACVAVFAAATAAAWSAPSLILFRMVGAAIGAATGPASLAIINRMFERERRAQALGYWSLVAAGGPVVGVVVGGPIVQAVSWRWIFVAQVPLTLLTIAVCAVVFPDTPRRRDTRFDLAGAVTLGAGVGALVVALNRAPELGWTSPVVLGGIGAGAALLVGFVAVERRVAHPLMPLDYLRRRNVAFGFVNQFFTNFAYMGGFYLTPFLLQHVLDWSPTRTGLVSIARPAAFAIAGPVAGWLATRIGERVNAVAGGLFLVASMVVFTTVGPASALVVILLGLVLSGLGMGTTAPAVTAAIANSVENRDLGVVGAAQQMMSQVGVVVGTQVMVTVQHARTAVVGEQAAYAEGYMVGAGAALVGVVAAVMMRSTKHAPHVATDDTEAVRIATGSRPVTRDGAPAGAPSF